ncbi:MAG: hypothetical protein GXP63_03890 [DPANN group archaeon]|nr:hypothetical protein [DPANN group archaeon]
MIKDLVAVYDSCVADGHLYNMKEADAERATTLLEIAEQDSSTLAETSPIMEKMKNFSLLWSSRYEVIRKLVDGILLLEMIKSDNHQCLYAYLCLKHDEWEIDWETIETMRLLRNAVHYEGKPIKEETWNAFRLKFDIYTTTFISILKDMLKELQPP